MAELFNSNRRALGLVAGPQATDTFKPILYLHAYDYIQERIKDLLRAQKIAERFGLSRKGQHMMAVCVFATEHPGHQGALAVRMAYNGDHVLTLCSGLFVPSDDVVVINPASLRKVTFRNSNVWPVYQAETDAAVYSFKGYYDDLNTRLAVLKALPISTDRGYQLLGLAIGHKVITHTQGSDALRRWRGDAGEPDRRDLYRLFQCCIQGVHSSNTAGEGVERLCDVLTFFEQQVEARGFSAEEKARLDDAAKTHLHTAR